MLAITGVSFLMGSTCKTAISDIVVYKSEDKITDAIASVDPNLKGDELDKVFDYLENDKDLRKIADMYVDAAIKVASYNKNKDKTLEEMLSETQTSEMNNAVSSFTDNLVSKVFGDEANNISGIAATLYNAVKQSVPSGFARQGTAVQVVHLFAQGGVFAAQLLGSHLGGGGILQIVFDLAAHIIRAAAGLFQLIAVVQRGHDGSGGDGNRIGRAHQLIHIKIQALGQILHVIFTFVGRDHIARTADGQTYFVSHSWGLLCFS